MTSSQKGKPVIALIDDDDGPIEYYEIALADAGFGLNRLKSFKDALDFILGTDNPPAMWVVDVMMPIGDDTLKIDGIEVVRTTNFGLAAGLELYRQIKRRFPAAPVMMLTSISTPDLLDEIEKSLEAEDTCEAKLSVLPSELAALARTRIDSGKKK